MVDRTRPEEIKEKPISNPEPKIKKPLNTIEEKVIIPEFSDLLAFARNYRDKDECNQFFNYNSTQEEYFKLYGKSRKGGGTRGAVKLTLSLLRIYTKYQKEGKLE